MESPFPDALADLKRLIARHGFKQFVNSPLVIPHAHFFPEGWRANATSVAIVFRRLLGLAQVKNPKVRIEDYAGSKSGTRLSSPQIEFSELADDGEFWFDLYFAGAAAEALGVVSHEVGLAMLHFWQKGEKGYRESTVEEPPTRRLGSIASVYLGLGIPATAAAHQIKHDGKVEGGYNFSVEWSVATAGGLDVGQMEYLLALQLVVRNRKQELKNALAHLPANQEASVQKWVKQLTPMRAELVQLLGLPDDSTWGDGSYAIPRAAPGRHAIAEHYQAIQAAGNHGREISRLETRKTAELGVAGILVGAIVGASIFPFGAFVGLALGLALGRSMVKYRCIGSGCSSPLSSDDTECGNCGGKITNTITSVHDRLALMEDSEDENDPTLSS